jgi:hypothetical protein
MSASGTQRHPLSANGTQASAHGTQGYARLHRRGLTVAQQSAVDLLAGGNNDTETAELLKLARPTVSKWRLYDPAFQAALNARRAEVWGAGLDRLRALIPQALDAVGDALAGDNPAARLKAAGMVLSLARLPDPAPAGPTSAADILAALVEARKDAKQAERDKHLCKTDRMLASMRSPSREEAEAAEREARAEVLAELEAQLGPEEES